MLRPMPASERLYDRGTRRGERLTLGIGEEFREQRISAGLTQRQVAAASRTSASLYSRIERGKLPSLSITHASRIASVLGMDLSVRAYPAGSPLRDTGHAARLRRLLDHVASPLSYRTEVGLPQRPDQPTERRAWDAVLRGEGQKTAIELEMRLRDGQAVERRLSLKWRDDPVDRLLVAVADTRTNRRVLAEQPDLFGGFPRLRLSRVIRTLESGEHPPTGLVLV